MFVVNISYKVDLSDVEPHMQAHIDFLDRQYKGGYFIASGRKVPRTGGVILAKAKSREALNEILCQDPFYTNELATYDVVEFVVSKASVECEALLNS